MSDGGVVVCKRCGKCCHLIINDKLSSKPCRFLIPLGNNRFACRIYNVENRLGYDIGYGNRCLKRSQVHINYPGCSYNKTEWGLELSVGDEFGKEK